MAPPAPFQDTAKEPGPAPLSRPTDDSCDQLGISIGIQSSVKSGKVQHISGIDLIEQYPGQGPDQDDPCQIQQSAENIIAFGPDIFLPETKYKPDRNSQNDQNIRQP